MYKLAFYVPEAQLETVKAALFQKGAGRIGQYDSCAWQTKGRGQYRPLSGSQPFVGTPSQLETVEEYLVEMVCEEQVVKTVVAELKRTHPYEEVAYAVYKINDII